MTIAMKIELVENWGQNAPLVLVQKKTLRGVETVAWLTPDSPLAHVTITQLNDLLLTPGPEVKT